MPKFTSDVPVRSRVKSSLFQDHFNLMATPEWQKLLIGRKLRQSLFPSVVLLVFPISHYLIAMKLCMDIHGAEEEP